jgi:hypothetical protein
VVGEYMHWLLLGWAGLSIQLEFFLLSNKTSAVSSLSLRVFVFNATNLFPCLS